MAKRLGDLSQVTEALNGSPQSLGVIIATATSKNNHTTATPFNDTGDGLGAKILMLQSDADCYVITGTTNAVVAVATATSSSWKISAGERVVITPKSNEGWIACITAAGTANLKVWEMI